MPPISETNLILNSDGSIYHLSLLPRQVSETIITVGDPSRVYRISEHFDSLDFEMNKREFITHIGKYKGKRVTVMSTGIGTDNIELFMTELDALVNVDLTTREPRSRKKKLSIIRIGTSGAIQENVPVGSFVVTDYAIGLDNLMDYYNLVMDEFEEEIAEDLRNTVSLPHTPYIVKGSSALKKQFAHDMISGNTITTPGFFAPQGRKVRLPIRYPNMLDDLRKYYNKPNDFRVSNFEMETAGYYAMCRLLGHEAISLNAIIANRPKNKFAKDPNKVIDGLIEKVLDRI
ncbi:MAG TPA: nucleoside phosphorylase [Cyclobacteriaceae bacterium]|nr:nucleoside phosphorylase [Cyclobacteriaceae bacterium]